MELEEMSPMDDVVVGESDERPELTEIEEPTEEPAVENAAGMPRLESIVESLLFAAGTPVALRRLVQLLDGPTSKEVVAAIGRLQQRYDGSGRGLRLVEVAGGYQFRTAPENADWVRTLLREKPARIGRATLETLAIIAYKQPATRAEIEAIRGVDVEGPLTSLLSKRLIKIAGRKETVGRPLLYVTTPEFLEVFGLKDLNDLPTLKELPSGETSNDETPEAFLAATAGESTDDTAAAAEAAESGGCEIAADGGVIDPRGESADKRPGGDGTGDEGGPVDGSDHR
jgi:segregation and condensation protein B